jgi:hypothetical protein
MYAILELSDILSLDMRFNYFKLFFYFKKLSKNLSYLKMSFH